MGTSAVPCSAEYPLRDRHCVIVAVCCSPNRNDEWTILYDDAGAGVDTLSDVLALELVMADPAFVLYTQWNGFQPSSAYRLELPVGQETLEATGAIVEQSANRQIGKGFCTVLLRLTEEVFSSAKAGTPETACLQFHVPEYRWEYLFVSRGGEKFSPEKLRAGGMRRQTDIRAVRGGGRIWQGSAAYRFPRKDSPAETVRVPAPSDIRHRRRQPPQTGVAAQCGTAQAGRFPEQSPGVTPAVMLFLDCNPLHITRLLNH